jgi:hypothetical protein
MSAFQAEQYTAKDELNKNCYQKGKLKQIKKICQSDAFMIRFNSGWFLLCVTVDWSKFGSV